MAIRDYDGSFSEYNINPENKTNEYLHGVLFTRKNMNNTFFVMTKNIVIPSFNPSNPYYQFRIMKLNPDNIEHVKTKDFKPLTKENFEIYPSNNDLYVSPHGVLVNKLMVNEENHVGGMEVNLNKNGNLYLSILTVNRNYREYGLSKTFIETLKTMAVENNIDHVDGFMTPLDKIVKRSPLMPARVFPPMVLRTKPKENQSTKQFRYTLNGYRLNFC